MRDAFRRGILISIKNLVVANNFTLPPRDKNVGFLRERLLDNDDVKNIILDLTPSDCVAGPEKDRDGYKGLILKFKINYLNEIIYIKIRYHQPDEVAIISFHKARYI